MKVLVLGATGFVGLPIAQAYVRAGHQVYGVTRSAEKAKSLQADEIIPVVATMHSEWAHLVPIIDVLVDAAATTGPDGCRANIKAATDALTSANASKERLETLKMTYIFTSGTWCHGDTFNSSSRKGSAEWKDERNARFDDSGLVNWRTAIEQEVLSSSVFNGIVIRPGLVYGRSASILAALFAAAHDAAKDGKASFEWAATPGKRWGLIHQDDVADLFLRAGEAAPITKHLIFDAVNPFSESVEDVLSSLARVVARHFSLDPTGFHHTYRVPSTPFEKAIDTHALTRPSLGQALVGWVPKKRGLVDGMDVYYEAWLASL